MNLAHLITMSRLLLAPLFITVYLMHSSLGIPLHCAGYVLLLIAVVIELTDLFDGHVARKYGMVSLFGKIFDPVVDSIVRVSFFIAFSQPPVSLPIGVCLLFFWRDSIISFLRILAAKQGITLSARPSGKLKALFQGTVIIVIVVFMILAGQNVIDLDELKSFSFVLAMTCAIYTLLSGLDYIFTHRNVIRKALIS